ncbi:cytochrome P450 93A3-like [Rutidosis leptorrhynchoides]|uniref:cytochrome P450 93A3-like n=1 Tax=Rutidosis leptorrhynchoides TaxID=125765 RepID=UPI003A99B2D4
MGDFQTYFITFIMFTTFIWALFKFSRAISHLPPTAFSLSIIGHLHLLAPIPQQALYKISIRYGPIFRVILGSTPCIVACSPEIAEDFLKTHENAYLDRPGKVNKDDYMNHGSNEFIFVPYGPYWKFMRKILRSQLLNETTLDSLSLFRRDECNHFINLLSQYAKVGKAVHLGGELIKLTNNVLIIKNAYRQKMPERKRRG